MRTAAVRALGYPDLIEVLARRLQALILLRPSSSDS